MKKIVQYLILLLFFTPTISKAQFENVRDSVVQLYGVVMTADSLVGIPAVSVVVKRSESRNDHQQPGSFLNCCIKRRYRRVYPRKL